MGEQAPEAGVTQLASELGLTKATVHRLLNAMERFELIERNAESERYRLGLKLHQLGNKAVESGRYEVKRIACYWRCPEGRGNR